MKRRLGFVRFVWVIATFVPVFAAAPFAQQVSQSGLFHVSYQSKLDPIVINRIHSWVLHVETVDGHPVADADIVVEGGMPAHDHGLPTRPRMTQSLGDGDYLIEGMRFHMNGYWEIAITISTDGDRDTVVIPLEL
ncbi:MAG: FixH family protein [Woeseiaceae bacterium]